jgi:hypothetical protein
MRWGLHPVRSVEHGGLGQSGGLGRGHDAAIRPPGYQKPERLPIDGAAPLPIPRGHPPVRFGESGPGRTDGCVMVAFRSMVHVRGCSWRQVLGNRWIVVVNRRAVRFGSSGRQRTDGTADRAQHPHRRSCGERADHDHAD